MTKIGDRDCYCDFCGKHRDFVDHMVASVKAHICGDCARTCVEVVEGRYPMEQDDVEGWRDEMGEEGDE